MKKSLLPLLFAFVSCGLSESYESSRFSGNESWKNPSYEKDSTSSGIEVCYMTALEYPEGYDWRADRESGTVKCSLTVYADFIPVMKIPVGDRYETSPDPDMHRIIDGHLYSDFSTGTETVIKRDGEELFRYPAREMIVAIAVHEDGIHTLGKPRDSDGFSYRVNGAIQIERKSGKVFPRISYENDMVCFAFAEHIASLSGNMERYYACIDGRIEQVAVREDIIKVWDILIHEGKISYIATMTGISFPVIVEEEKMTSLEMYKGMDVKACRLMPVENSIATEVLYSYYGLYTSGIWKSGKRYGSFLSGCTVRGICTWKDGICCVVNGTAGNSSGTIFRCGETFKIPEGYSLMGDNPMAVVNGILNIGFSSLKGEPPLIWKDGKIFRLETNGPICTLTVD